MNKQQLEMIEANVKDLEHYVQELKGGELTPHTRKVFENNITELCEMIIETANKQDDQELLCPYCKSDSIRKVVDIYTCSECGHYFPAPKVERPYECYDCGSTVFNGQFCDHCGRSKMKPGELVQVGRVE